MTLIQWTDNIFTTLEISLRLSNSCAIRIRIPLAANGSQNYGAGYGNWFVYEFLLLLPSFFYLAH